MKPICKECKKENKKYSVEVPLYGATTSMCLIPAHWDEDGNYHEVVDPNTTTLTYRCSNGHSWKEVL